MDAQTRTTRPRVTFHGELAHLLGQVYRELMTCILSDPTSIRQVNYLLWAAHNLERAADRVTNVWERTLFVVTGKMVELS